MAGTRPYAQFNFLVTWGGSDTVFAGFSEVTGLNAEITAAEYRGGTAKEVHGGKIPRLRKYSNITLKRGLVASAQLSSWIKLAGTPAARRNLVVTLRDEKGAPARRWILHGTLPVKWTGPELSAKGGDVAMEDLVLSHEGLTVE